MNRNTSLDYPEEQFSRSLRQIWEGSQYSKKYHTEKSLQRKWKIVIKMILGCITWRNWLSRRAEQANLQFFSFMQTNPDRKLMFDLDLFRANTNSRVHPKVRHILSLPGCDKSDADLHFVQTALQDITSFSEYPLVMQRNLCRVGWYQGVEPKRVILKEGHRAATFYFILSGTVVITERDKTTGISRTKCMIQRGMSFGELAIVNPNGLRSATVLSKTFTEMLCIDARDFESIFICGGTKAITDRDVIHFLSSLRYLHNFPFHLLREEPDAMLYYHFGRGQVLVKDSNHSDWIYIIKSGSVSVIKKLLNKDQWKKVKPEELDRNRTPCTVEMIGHAQSKLSQPRKGQNSTQRAARKIKELKGNYQHNSSPIQLAADGERHSCNRKMSDQHQRSRLSASKALSLYQVATPNLPPLVEGKPTAVAQLDSYKFTGSPTTVDLYPAFLHVQLLERGQTFGMIPMLFENQPSFSAVSNGADCILISKQFYLQHVSNFTLEQAYTEVSPYPDDPELEQKLKEQVEWSQFRRQYYNHYIDAASRIKSQLTPRA